MKVQCEKCNARFNYEKSMGICPKCNRYMQPKSIEEGGNKEANKEPNKVPNNEPFNGSNKDLRREHDIHEVKTTSTKKRRITGKSAAAILLIGIIAAIPIYTYVKADKDIDKIYAERKYEKKPVLKEVQENGFDIATGHVKIADGQPIVKEHMRKIPGFVYLMVPYTMDGKDDYDHPNQVYLKVDGKYLTPLMEYELTESEEYTDDFITLNVRDSLLSGGGNFIFAVPEGDHSYEIFVQEQTVSKETYEKKVAVNHLMPIKVEEK